jgi:hypothetical protein
VTKANVLGPGSASGGFLVTHTIGQTPHQNAARATYRRLHSC